MPFLFLNHVPTWDVSKFYNWQVEQPRRNRIELWIPCLDIIVYIGFVYSHHMEYLLAFEEFMEFRWLVWTNLDIAQ